MSDDDALVTLDLTGGPDETPVTKFGRIVGGIVLMIVGGVIAVVSFVASFASGFLPDLTFGEELLGEGLFITGIIGIVIAFAGFELVRRSRKARRAAEAAEAAEVMAKLKAEGVYDGASTPGSIAQAMEIASDQWNDLTGGTQEVTPVKPPISGPTIT